MKAMIVNMSKTTLEWIITCNIILLPCNFAALASGFAENVWDWNFMASEAYQLFLFMICIFRTHDIILYFA